MIRLNSELGEQYKQQAIEELTALGVTFPVGIDYYISGSNQTALDSATVLAQCFSDSLGDDYVQLNIKTYVSSASQEVYEPKLQSINISGWALTTVTRRTIWARKLPATIPLITPEPSPMSTTW